MSNIIEVRNLKKYFGDIKAVDDLSFDVEKGSLFAFLGLNGAGKSTTINIICGDLEKDSGEVFVSGKNIDKDLSLIKSMLGVVYQESVLDKQLTVKDNLECRAVLYGLNKVQFQERLIQIDKLFSIKELLSRPVGKLSGGQRRRVDIARAILHNPQILILDEPTTGLDPQTRKMVWSAVEKLRKENEITNKDWSFNLVKLPYRECAFALDYFKLVGWRHGRIVVIHIIRIPVRNGRDIVL